ncbi:MAG: DUF5305 domain-containing protein [Oscillospiraceae bacterium]|nr:DUF5305 domain-containing protein [Oscillospiraceae bacterium]
MQEKNGKDKNSIIYIRNKKKMMKKLAITLLFIVIASGASFLSIFAQGVVSFNYTERSNLNYRVNLKENDYYDVSYLPAGMSYIANLINYIDVTFDYNFSIDDDSNIRDMEYIEYTYFVELEVMVFERNNQSAIIFQNTERLTPETTRRLENSSEINISRNVRIDYSAHNKFIREFKTSNNIAAESTLTLNFYVDINGKHERIGEPVNINSNMKMVIPLAEQTFMTSIDHTEINANDDIFVVQNGMLTTILKYISYLFIIITVISMAQIILLIVKINGKKSLYQRQMDRILRNYDRVVIEVKKMIQIQNEEAVIDVTSFEQLLDVSDRLSKSILFMEIDENQKSWFIVKNGEEVYRYILEDKRSLIEKKEKEELD